ncbi:hypothetical protein TVNIR_1869 [Thioalkalivibrio nitratireducens DSM 14787]|uniref:Uncharacterized protein n=1 Tax=Thioalkalivibrio nitratireducens (strain DSM 14787 / UNIQEM 213 / ALEN2) TaxID=1255043 RepID=L0DX39_THIND|nr:hypothetical protein [Thioalkalivibrio nitratireducens]AGA33530.1 hypothetical protein TVNIR_1869 [Thioalkalivibrio nitratireducens DSM 14787]
MREQRECEHGRGEEPRGKQRAPRLIIAAVRGTLNGSMVSMREQGLQP